MTEETAKAPPQAKLGEVHDVTSVYMPPFKFRVPELVKGESTGKNLDYSIDFDQIGIALQGTIPSALMPCGKYNGETGKKRRELSGLEYSFKLFMNGKADALPPNLPSINHILNASAKAFQLPENYPPAVVMAVLGAYFQEGALRANLKKGRPGSPESPGSTRARSTRRRSPRKKSRG